MIFLLQLSLPLHTPRAMHNYVINFYKCLFLRFSGNEASAMSDTVKVKHILLQHQDKVMCGGSEDMQRIVVRRSHLFSDALRTFSRLTFEYLKVTFVGEPDVDEGGPRRELFRLLIQSASTSGLFAGSPGHLTPIHCVEALSSNKFYVALATALIQGGQPPVCFSKPAADFLIFGSIKCARRHT